MKARYVVMAAVLLLAVALGLCGRHEPDQSAAPVDPSVLTALDAAGGGSVRSSSMRAPATLAT